MSNTSKYEREAQSFYWFAKGALKGTGAKNQVRVLQREIARIEALRGLSNPRDKV